MDQHKACASVSIEELVLQDIHLWSIRCPLPPSSCGESCECVNSPSLFTALFIVHILGIYITTFHLVSQHSIGWVDTTWSYLAPTLPFMYILTDPWQSSDAYDFVGLSFLDSWISRCWSTANYTILEDDVD